MCMRLITLTNSNTEQKGQSILINPEHIVSVNRGTITRDDGVLETVTFIFMPPHGTWEVSETLEEILALLESHS
jgi:hypothetical protein